MSDDDLNRSAVYYRPWTYYQAPAGLYAIHGAAPSVPIFKRKSTDMNLIPPTPAVILALLAIGIAVGMISGVVGIGGGVLVIPILMIGFGFSQVRANGTSLAMLLPPIGIFAALSYWRAGNVNVPYAALLAIGFAAGAYVGASAVNSGLVGANALRILFSIMLLYIAGRMLFRADPTARAALEITLLMTAYLFSHITMRIIGRRLDRMPNWPVEYRKRRAAPLDHDYEI
jgi:hypothetical protein